MIYSPAEDSYLLAKCIPKYVKGKSFLDMGAGSGIQSDAALAAGASSVLAVDINPEAVAAVKKKGIRAVRSDLFKAIKGKFDVIAFNPPYLPADSREDKESSLITSGGERGDELTLRFLKEAVPHLSPKGNLLFVVSSLAPLKDIKNVMTKLGLKKRTIAREKFFMESIEVWVASRP